MGNVSSKKWWKKQALFNWHGFWFKPKPSHNISKKKRNHCLRNQRYKNMQLYHNIVKNWGRNTLLFLRASATITFFYGPRKKRRPLPLFFTPHKKIILLTLFLIWPLTTANYAENHTKKQRTTKDTVHKNVVRKPADSNHGYILVDGTRKTKYTVGQEKKAQAH